MFNWCAGFSSENFINLAAKKERKFFLQIYAILLLYCNTIFEWDLKLPEVKALKICNKLLLRLFPKKT